MKNMNTKQAEHEFKLQTKNGVLHNKQIFFTCITKICISSPVFTEHMIYGE